MGWANYVALGDSLTAGRDDHGPGGARIGWARRLAGILTARTSVCCALTNLAFDGLFGPDRIHPNGSGHQLMADAFAALLLTH